MDHPAPGAVKQILKRDGTIKPFDPQKIVLAIAKAGKATGELGMARAQEMVDFLVLPRLTDKNVETLHIEEVQDAVEHALFEAGYFTTLRAYIVYRESRAKARDAKKELD